MKILETLHTLLESQAQPLIGTALAAKLSNEVTFTVTVSPDGSTHIATSVANTSGTRLHTIRTATIADVRPRLRLVHSQKNRHQ